MFLSVEWLNDFLDLSEWPAEVIADKMSRTGIEIEGVENFGQDLSHLVVGQVKEMIDHPDSNHLHVCQVDVGNQQINQIVCGAPNVKENEKVIVALPGSTLPGGVTIKAGNLRGQVSNGMLCSLQELGFSDSVVPKKYADGLFLLPEDAPVGADVIDYLKLDDPILELSITPNRADVLSMRGSAFEIGAIVSQKPQLNNFELENLINPSFSMEDITVSIENESLSDRYQLRLIKDVKIVESPIWMQMRLMKAGIRPINNVVDVTNYCLLTFGQPMHAFDYDALPSKDISVRMANNGQKFVTLDEVGRQLTANDILIYSGETPVALAGVMGGLDSEVTTRTKNVLLETAVFEPIHVRNTAKRFNLRSESSSRFEKGINQADLNEAGEFAANLMAQLGSGLVCGNLVEVTNQLAKSVEVTLDLTTVEHKLGVALSQMDIESIFNRLGFKVAFQGQTFKATVPPRRWDISIQADIIEEIARIYGYDKLPTTLPSVPSTPGKLNAKQKLVRQSRQICESLGLNQTISYVLTSPKQAQLMAQDANAFVELDFPISEERSVLRQSMMPALIEIAKYNNARHNKPLAFYEMGKVFVGQGPKKQPLEKERIAFLISGQKSAKTWYDNENTYDFYDLKGMVEYYLSALRISNGVHFEATQDITELHPGRTAKVFLDNQYLGVMGQVHPRLCQTYDLDKASYFVELDFDLLLNYQRKVLVQTPIPKFPSTSRDLAILINQEQSYDSLVSIMQQSGGDYLTNIELFDLYEGDNLEEGKKSLAYRLTFQDPQQTLTDEVVNQAIDDILHQLSNIDGLSIR